MGFFFKTFLLKVGFQLNCLEEVGTCTYGEPTTTCVLIQTGTSLVVVWEHIS